MQHLTRYPGYRRFAFTRGFAANSDSLEREATFNEGLRLTGISADPELLLEGNYLASDAFAVMDELLTRRQDIDVVVAANDDMALGIINALNRHGLSVLYDVAVVGFDDVAESTTVTPPLTTVR